MSTTESVGNIASGLLSSIGAALSTHLQDKALKKMDTDSNGSVGQSEFQVAMDKVAGKLGIDMGEEGAASLFASFDADVDGTLNAAEVGQAIKNVFMPPENTQAFVQSRGGEARFSELDADGDGSISMAEFGINPAQSGEMSMVSTTTTTTTYVSNTGETTSGSEPVTGSAAAQALAAATGASKAAAEPATATAAADPLQDLIGSLDSDGDGQISGAELSTFVAQLSSQLEAASKKYNDVALASASSSKALDEAA
jgi:Ca2+-binding EF-hand superfamily protein